LEEGGTGKSPMVFQGGILVDRPTSERPISVRLAQPFGPFWGRTDVHPAVPMALNRSS